MESSSTLRAKKASEAINMFKSGKADFTSDELSKAMKELKCPYPTRILSVLINSKQIKKIGSGLYSFSFPVPVYFHAIEKELDSVASTQALYVKKYENKISKTKTVKISGENLTEEQAIKLLKGLGYKILKPITEFKEL